ncbi:MAG: hypothetical protein ACW99Q_06500 [Candidatus Kariarchaeaceae archaeon]|jgi:hypothetical protein
MKKKNLLLIVVLMLLPVLSVGGFILLESRPPSLTIDNVRYQVDELGDLTIQLQGFITGLSVEDLQIGLGFPSDFANPKLEDGSSVLTIINHGKPTSLNAESNLLNMEFTLTNEISTFLPITYNLSIIAPELTEICSIQPKWVTSIDLLDSKAGGSGAAVKPYITSYIAYDRTKGQSALFKTYIYNPVPIEKPLTYVQHTIKGEDYNDWVDTKQMPHEVDIMGYTTYVATDYIGPSFTAQSSKKYAFNSGDYQIESVKAQGLRWSNTYYPSEAVGDFDISVSSTDQVIFAAVVYDSEFSQFLSTHSKSIGDLFSDVQSNPIDLHCRSNSTYLPESGHGNGMEDLFDLEFQYSAIQNQWWDDNGNSSESPSIPDILGAGQTFLDSTNDWNYQGGHGTDDYNHGFDLLFACTGQGLSGEGAVAPGGGNNWVRLSFNSSISWKFSIIGTLHEVCHQFLVDEGDKEGTPTGYIMNGGTQYSGGPNSHSYATGWFRMDYLNNYLVYTQNEDTFDGFG